MVRLDMAPRLGSLFIPPTKKHSKCGSRALSCWNSSTSRRASHEVSRSERDRPRRHVLICQFAAGPVNPSHQWQRRTNVWREATSPARGFRRLTSDRQRGAIPLAPPIGETRCGVSVAGLSPPFGGASCAEAEHELAPSRPVFLPLPRRQSRGVPGTIIDECIHRRTLRPQAETAGSRADTLDREREGGRSAISAAEVSEEGPTARRAPA